MIFNIFLTLLFVLANAFCVAAEFAIVRVRTSQLKILAKDGSRLAAFSEGIVTHLDSYLSATQLGITLASLGLGWIGEPVVGQIIFSIINFIGIDITERMAHDIALPTAFVLISFLHIVFGELAPKSIAIIYPEKVTIALSIPLKIIHFILKPFIVLLNGTSNMVLKIFGLHIPDESETQHSTEEIRMIIEENSKYGGMENTEQQLLENIFDFTETPIKQVMVPRNNIEAMDKKSELNEIIDKMLECGYSRIPIYEDEIDNIVGIIYGKDLLKIVREPQKFNIDNIIRKPLFFKENELLHDVLKKIQKTHIQMAIVYNEFGGTAGLVTIEDILEEIVGEIQDEHDAEDSMFEATTETSWEIAASLPIHDVNDFAHIEIPESENYETLSGYITSVLSRIPTTNEVFSIGNYKFTILNANDRKIEKVKIEKCI